MKQDNETLNGINQELWEQHSKNITKFCNNEEAKRFFIHDSSIITVADITEKEST